ncbi:quinone oxidoreductase [Sporothrix schenckii 1099-18]|uniref:Enoyl reductase (ER) domain-containing protein n=2 Tax=Sporothrix schenckii TaxID=29908 RepID=U7PIS1_SPOS1|nr:quinone oxidoreductase [Sporothrix schenckii 1099-18]ERS94836.1 hypothetical protein HMPREF1624_08733 [Sporothrix schenckii ATCC 58251]KJR89019.1 quinone oxidoreductase [Sporothrix schenckii 1099-18]
MASALLTTPHPIDINASPYYTAIMKEAQVSKDTVVQIVDVPVPNPAAGQVLIKVVVSGSNPKDWKLPAWRDLTHNSGDDIAGIIASVGAGVTEFKAGDRVAAFHEIGEAAASFAEYALAWAHTTFHIPETTSFEEASTIPLVALTAAVALFHDLGLPDPWTTAAATDKPDPWKSLDDSGKHGAVAETPLVVYGASSGVGAAAIQLARLANIHPVIAVAGQSTAFVETLLDKSKGDVVVDYRGGDDAAIAALKKAVGGRTVRHAVNAISEGSSNYIVSSVLQPDGHVSLVLPWKDDERIKGTVQSVLTSVGRVHRDLKDLGFVYSRYLGRALSEGTFKGHPYEVVPGGLAGVQTGLQKLRDGKAHGIKYVFRIADTEGASKDKL